VGAYEAGALALVEATLKYHPDNFEVLTLARNPGWEQCMVGSLTGAVSSQRVTEECNGTLSAVGHRAFECNGIRVLDCETYMSSRNESWS
jgi:Family of unknown function (DUF6467)